MPVLRTAGVATFILLTALLCTLPAYSTAEEKVASTNVVRIGMIDSLFRDIPESTVLAMMQPFQVLMETQTGVSGRLVPSGGAHALGLDLAEDRVQLGVFHGIEFAWARQKFPDLRPLMIAINEQQHLKAQLVVRADSGIANVNELKNKTICLPKGTREHCHLFLKSRCQKCGSEPTGFFNKIMHSPNAEDAIDDVVDGVVQATVVDAVSLECYKRRKPGRFVKLQAPQESEIFPAAVIAYRPGVIDERTLQRFREGMINANKNPMGRQLLTLWKLTAFERVPDDYEQILDSIVKAYPCPCEGMK